MKLIPQIDTSAKPLASGCLDVRDRARTHCPFAMATNIIMRENAYPESIPEILSSYSYFASFARRYASNSFLSPCLAQSAGVPFQSRSFVSRRAPCSRRSRTMLS